LISTVLSLERYKKLRVKYATQIEDGMFDPNGFIEDMKPFFADRERKYLAYTSEKNEIDKRPKLKNINDLKNYIQELLNHRYEKYRKCSDIKINIDDKNIAQVVREILVYI